MTTMKLHALPQRNAVLKEQFRFMGYGIRREAIIAAALLTLLSIGLAISVRLNGLTVDFQQEFALAFTLLGVLFPLAVWKGQDRSRESQLWALPVDHREQAFLRVGAGWGWLMIVCVGLLLWFFSLVVLTGGNIVDDNARIVLGSAGEMSQTQWSTPAWWWVVPFTAATVAYLYASAFALATEHPWRWIAGAIAVLLVSAIGGEAGLAWMTKAFTTPIVHRYGIDSLLTGGGPSLNTSVEINGEAVRAWRSLPSLGNWAIATLIWSAVGVVAVWAATLRFREQYRTTVRHPAKNMVSRAVVSAACLLMMIPASGNAQHFPSNDSLTALAKPFVTAGRTKGMVLAVLEADGTTRIVSVGSAGEGARELSANSLFEIGSITKSMTATLLAEMVANGKVSLSDPVSKYLPDVKIPSRNGREITLLDLATHYSGLPRMAGFDPADDNNPYMDFEIRDLYASLSNHQLLRDPGAKFDYSNFGYGLLGHALARAAGTSFEELVTTRLLKPLGMTATHYNVKGKPVHEQMTKGHDVAGKITPHWIHTEASRGAGGLVSNATDMLAFLAANVGAAQTPLERAMRDAHRGRAHADEREIGLAWFHRTVAGRDIVFNGGDTGGYHSFIGFDPQKQVGMVLLSNSDSKDAQLLAFAMSLLAPFAVDTSIRAVPLAAKDIPSYEGTFAYVSNGASRQLRVFGENGTLKAQIVGGPTLGLRHQGNHTFAATAGPNTIRIVFTVVNGRAERITIHQRGQEIPGERVP